MIAQMWPFVEAKPRHLGLVSLLLLLADGVCAQGDSTPTPRDVARSSLGAVFEPTCEARTVNYITHSLPQQCLTTGPISSTPISEPVAVTVTTTTAANAYTEHPAQTKDVVRDEYDPEGEDLSTGAFMSFEEWKAMMLAKSGPDALEAKPRRNRDAVPVEGFDTLGEEGEISFDFDAYSDKLSEIASSARPPDHGKEKEEQLEKVTYDEGFTYYRSKDAGTTCKERFSYSSFDAGATVKKASPGAKNPTAILVENKDSYMLMECGTKNKFFIVELSDVILVDTVVLANFEFFSSMMRQFRVSISDRYPVKEDKWKVLGTFEARNSRDIQPFLVENPQDWARYLRVEILSHYGNEYYCPVSLLRVHGLRMLDSWKQVDPSELEAEDESPPTISEPAEESVEVSEEPPIQSEQPEAPQSTPAENGTAVVMEQSCWTPYWDEAYFDHTYPLKGCAHVNTSSTSAASHENEPPRTVSGGHRPTPGSGKVNSAIPNTSSPVTAPRQTAEPTVNATKSGASISTEHPVSSVTHTPPTASSAPGRDNSSVAATGSSLSQTVGESTTGQNVPRSKSTTTTSIKPPSSKSSTRASQTTPRNRTSTTTSTPPPTPTVQDSFFKALTKRLQVLESNTTLSLQYIESQSKFLQEALAKLERRQIAKVDLFLDKLNNTVLGELREVRTLYDHIWQSTVIALETQREQTENEIVALSTRVGVLADEVVFQKRMAIVQSVLLLGCLVLVIFSRGFAGSAVEAYYPSQFLAASPPRLASPGLPTTPKAQFKRVRPGFGFPDETRSSANTAPARDRPSSDYSQGGGLGVDDGRSSSRTPEPRSRTGSKGAGSISTPQRLMTPTRALTDPSGADFHPPTPSSLEEMAYDSEPAMTPSADYFSAATSVNGDGDSSEGDDVPQMYHPDNMLTRQQLTPSASDSGSEYILSRSGRPGLTLTRSGSTRKPLPALPEDPDPD
ncbi:hypothetical protein GGS20DRAFT_526920 [Poronia punctata]|nr:hypothetical protein GGS20DRAFT_526920 [Poronia punctata]